MKKKYLTAEELLQLPETKVILESYGDEVMIKNKIRIDLAKTRRYKPNVYYHATGGCGEPGVGRGMYLGRDKKALNNFYNCDGVVGEVIEYSGNPKFLDLTIQSTYDNFEKEAISLFGKKIHNEHIQLLTLKKGFDGIRYYDPIATGEEFVLYNPKKISLIRKTKNRNIINSISL
ncbi:MAG: hypothetical protein HXY50_07795 [Ignavibacteriaceae bacterium]|nr:hypothetical protein [Ignavibacteriaceae bacterium]